MCVTKRHRVHYKKKKVALKLSGVLQGQQGGGGDSPPLLCPGKATSRVLSPVLGCSEQERQGTTRKSLVGGCKDYEQAETSPL